MSFFSLSVFTFLFLQHIFCTLPPGCSPVGSVAGCQTYNAVAYCSACLPGFYPSGTGGCYPNNCAACSSGGVCSTCLINYVAIGGACVGCPSNCNYCSSASACTTCVSTHKLYLGQCHDPCPLTTFTSGTNCLPCSTNCDICSSASICTSCSSGSYLYNNACGGSCPATTYISGSVCAPCGSNCDYCSSSSVCTMCSSGWKLYLGQCYNPCPLTTYTIGTNCQSCSPNCNICTDSSTCTTCSSTYYLYNSACHNPCPVTTYTSGTICAACGSNCDYCSSPSVCTTCSSGWKLYLGQCYNPCPITTYASGTTCQNCGPYCDYCSSSTTCTTCSSGWKLYMGQCYNPCPVTTWTSGVTCQNCPSNCDTCIDSATCSVCSSGWRLYQNLCYNPCPFTTFANGNICSDCPSHCKICTDGSTCTTCSLTYFLYQAQCYGACPVTTFTSGTNCLDCSSYCDVCVDQNTCTQCTAGYYFYQSKCYIKCPSKAPYLSPTITPYFCFETCPTATPYSDHNFICHANCPPEAPYLVDGLCSPEDFIAKIVKIGNTAGSIAGTGLLARSLASFSNPSLFMFGSLMKLLEYTRYMNISHSDKLEILFQTISDSTDFIPMPSMSDEMQDAFENHELPYVFARYDLPSNFMLNQGDDILGILTILSLFVMFWIMHRGVYYLRNVETIRSLAKNGRFFFQNLLIGKFYEMLGDVFFAAFFHFKTISMSDRYSWLSLWACISCLVLGAVLYLVNFWVIYAYQKKKNNLTTKEETKKKELEKFSEKYNGIEILFGSFEDESFLQQAVLIFFIARNIITALVIAIFYTMPLFQTAILIILSFFMMVYYLTIKPMKTRMEFAEQIGFEVLLFAVNASFFVQAMCDSMQASTIGVINATGQAVIVFNIAFKFFPLVFLGIQFGLAIWKCWKLLQMELGFRKQNKVFNKPEKKKRTVRGNIKTPRQLVNKSSSTRILHHSTFQIDEESISDRSKL